MVEKWLAVAGLLACLGVWAGMALGPARRQRWWARARGSLHRMRGRLRKPGQARQAQQQASEAIDRARRAPQVDRDGNVYRPDAFHKRKGRDKLH